MERPDIEKSRDWLLKHGLRASGLSGEEAFSIIEYALLLEQTVAKGYLAEQALEQKLAEAEAKLMSTARDWHDDEQTLERLTRRLEEIEADNERPMPQERQLHYNQPGSYARLLLAQELLAGIKTLKQLDPDSTKAEKE